MLYSLAADAVVIVHLAFILFVVGGGFLVWRWRRLVWLHAPAAVWGIWIEFAGWICPLTPWEIALRQRAGEAGYEAGFIQHYLVPMIYPGELTRSLQIMLGAFVLLANLVAYGGYLWRRGRQRGEA